MKIKLRPHHLLCIIGFIGKGYSDTFVNNFENVLTLLDSEENAVIEITNEADVICQPCPHRTNKFCDEQNKVINIDENYSQILHLKPGDVLTWQEIKERIKTHMTIDKFDKACADCEWKSHGMCAQALKDVLKN